MSKHITSTDRRSKRVPPASEVRVVIVTDRDMTNTTNHPDENPMIDRQTEKLAIEATIEALREHRSQMKTLTDACADMGHATAELVRKGAAARFPQRAPKAPPPVSTHLRRFTNAIAEKVHAITELLTDEQRTRIGAIAPSFISAALGNEPDVVAMVMRWMDLHPDEIVREMITNLDSLERSFAS
jgi:hypothetical protein